MFEPMQSTFRRRMPALVASAALLSLASSTFAHPGHDDGSGFIAGAHHPFTGVDHLFAMFAVGLIAARLGRRSLWSIPATFLAAMLCGGSLSLFGIRLPLVEPGILASVLVLGILVFSARNLSPLAVAALVGFFAMFHGYAHVVEMQSGQSVTAYAGGFFLATVLLHALGVGVGLLLNKSRIPRFARLAGASV